MSESYPTGEIPTKRHIVVLGGGVAGVSCASAAAALDPSCLVTLVTAEPTVKAVRDFIKITPVIDDFGVADEPAVEWAARLGLPNLRAITGVAARIDPEACLLHLHSGLAPLPFNALCICTGAQPSLPLKGIAAAAGHERLLGLRDADSVRRLAGALRGARRIVLIGNGGIALGIAHEVSVSSHFS